MDRDSLAMPQCCMMLVTSNYFGIDMRLIIQVLAVTAALLIPSVLSAQDEAPTAIVVIGVGTAHPSGVSTLFSNIPVIEMVWVPINMRRLEIDRNRPPLVVRREYCNPLALARASCPAGDQQIQYNAYEVPAGVYALLSITVSDSDLIDGDTASTDYFYPPDHLVFRSTLIPAMEDKAVPKLLLAPGGAYYIGNFIIDFDGKAPTIRRVHRDDPAAADVVREKGGADLPMSFLETAVIFFRGGVES
jgi:hypothetical protein